MKTILKLIFNFRAMFTICYDANYLDFKNDFLNLPKENLYYLDTVFYNYYFYG